MLLDGLHEDLDAGQRDRLEALGQPEVDLGGDAPGAAVRDQAGAVHAAEVPARGHVARAQVELDPKPLEHSTSHQVLQRIVAKEPEVPRPAPRRDPRRHMPEQPTRPLSGKMIEIGDPGRLELRLPGLRPRKTPEAVEREQYDLRFVGDDERRDQIEHRGCPRPSVYLRFKPHRRPTMPSGALGVLPKRRRTTSGDAGSGRGGGGRGV
jgi:hypothetical protein